MRAAASIFLLFIVFAHTFSTWSIKLDYLLNRDYIAQNLCVNKEKPQLHCNGKCYLAKKIAAQEKKEQQNTSPRQDQFDIIPFFVSQPTAVSLGWCFIKNSFIIRNERIFPSAPSPVFHPPSVITAA